jgi:hypothetical protein
MSAPLTVDEQLQQVEKLIEALRDHRGTGSEWEPAYDALKCVAKDLRAQKEDTITAAEHELTQRINRCKQALDRGARFSAMAALAQSVVEQWPTIRIAFRIATRLAEGQRVEA